ncbi:DNA polymerase delta subunit 3 [Apiospora saccharicola]
MDDYQNFLAQEILTEDKTVTYRLLSRTLKVHVNLAKQMLYEFHKTQNDRNPGSLMATYLVYGTRKSDEQDDDVEMTDSVSDKDETFSEPVPTKTLQLIREETLQETLQEYEVTSIHVYSLAPHSMKDLQFLSDAAQLVLNQTIEEDSPLTASQTYGTMFCPNARKREASRGCFRPRTTCQDTAKGGPSEAGAQADGQGGTKLSSSSSPNAAPALKRQGSSGGIGQMFAKQAAKPKKPAAPKREEVVTPVLSDEGEDDSEAMPEPANQKAEEDSKSRSDRQAALRRMMDESDGEEEEASKSKPESPAEDEPMEEDTVPPEPEAKVEKEPAEVVASTGDGRRRGRRRITKKKQIMDDQGYLVTIQEPGWESFSEEEAPAPKPQKAKPAAAEKAAPAAKGKKAAPKGQGNIMSFFGKK